MARETYSNNTPCLLALALPSHQTVLSSFFSRYKKRLTNNDDMLRLETLLSSLLFVRHLSYLQSSFPERYLLKYSFFSRYNAARMHARARANERKGECIYNFERTFKWHYPSISTDAYQNENEI